MPGAASPPGRPFVLPLVLAALSLGPAARAAFGPGPTDTQVEAVFVYNFARFVAWPASSFSAADQPFVIGVLGEDPFGTHLDEAVHGEQIERHPLVVRHFGDISQVHDCQILYIDRSQEAQLPRILSVLDHRSTLTVSDLTDASRRGVMIQLSTEQRHVRVHINPVSVHAAGLTISASLLQLAQVEGSGGGR